MKIEMMKMKMYHSIEELQPLIEDNVLVLNEPCEILFNFIQPDIELICNLPVFFKTCRVKKLTSNNLFKADDLTVIDNLSAKHNVRVFGNVDIRGETEIKGGLHSLHYATFNKSVKVEQELIVWNGSLQVIGDLKVKEELKVNGGIYVTGDINAASVFSESYSVKCKVLRTKRLPYDRSYWANIPILRKWQQEILYGEYCWPDFKKMATEAEKQEIVSWEGWHPFLRVQLEMYLGLKQEVEWDKLHTSHYINGISY